MPPTEETNIPEIPPTQAQQESTDKNVLTIPVAIIVAGIIIGGAVFLSRDFQNEPSPYQGQTSGTSENISSNFTMRPLDANDHILGNPTADVVMLEYSDLECPFCKSFHKTMRSLLDQYGKDGRVSWAYRHFPLEIHPKSPKEAEATECAFELAGNIGFWNYVNKVFEVTPANNGLDPAKLPEIASQVGLDVGKFQACLDSGKYAGKIKDDYADGLKAGVNGTPHTVLNLKAPIGETVEKRLAEINQKFLEQMPPGSQNLISLNSAKDKIGISGAFPLPVMKEILELLLK